MDFIEKLLKTEVQTKELSEVDVKKIKRQMAKKGYKISEEEIANRIQEIEEAYKERRETRSRNIAFSISLLALLALAIQEELIKAGTLSLSGLPKALIIVMTAVFAGAAWLCHMFNIKNKHIAVWITAGVCFLIEIAIVIAIFLMK